MKSKKSNEKNETITDIIRIAVSAVLLFVSFIPSLSPIAHLITVLFAYVIIAYKTVIGAICDTVKGNIWGENSLMVLASIAALILKNYKEAVIIILLFSIGELFEDTAIDRSKKRINKLLGLRPDYANLYADGNVTKVSPDTVKSGDIIIAYPGEKIALDGIVVDGTGFTDTKLLTGEAEPLSVSAGDKVLCGYINLDSIIKIRVTTELAETTASKIMDAIENAPENRSNAEKFLERFAKIYTPTVFFLSAALAVIPSLITGEWTVWVYRALTLLIVSCPCSIVISVPLAFFCGLGKASHDGVLLKGSNLLESFAKLSAVAFDKTGTLTTGSFSVSEVDGKEHLLEYTAAAEEHSPHPVANAVKEAYNGPLPQVENLKNIPGLGVKCTIDGKEFLCGNDKLLKLSKIPFTPANSAGTVIYCAFGGEYYGHITASDGIKPEATDSINELKRLGIKKIAMLSGDKAEICNDIAARAGIDTVYAHLLPTDKVRITESISKEFGTTAFIGDGINDAPVLNTADIGVAMGLNGTDAAALSADAVLQNDCISKIPQTVKTGKKVMRIVKFNIAFSLLFKLTVSVLGIIGITGVPLAVIGDVGVLILTVLNSLRAIK